MFGKLEHIRYWVKYNLHKDGSPIWDGFSNKEDADKRILELQSQGYNPRFDNNINKDTQKETR